MQRADEDKQIPLVSSAPMTDTHLLAHLHETKMLKIISLGPALSHEKTDTKTMLP